MSRIIYYVATSIDGFLSGPNEDISGFVGKGVKLFSDAAKDVSTELLYTERYDNGLQIMTYRIKN